jgi:CRISPR-associated protein Cmr6
MRVLLERLGATPRGANTGLWIDRFLSRQVPNGESPPSDGHPHAKHFQTVADIPTPSFYRDRFISWQAALQDLPQFEHVRTGEAIARGRVVVGLGAEGVLENAITLHRAYGVPYLPGSALKGLAAAYAHRRLLDDGWRKPPLELKPDAPVHAHEVLFGSTRSAGYVTFFDALWMPPEQPGASTKPLEPDVLTVHHPKYYQGGAQPQAPADWDSPTPIAFLTATGSFLVALAGPKIWVDTAYEILALALDEMGVGGKTAAGYGRLTLEGLETIRARRAGATTPSAGAEPSALHKPVPAVPSDPEVAVADALITRINALSDQRVAGEINKFYLEAKGLTIDARQRARIAAALVARVRGAGREKASTDKAWYKEVLEWTTTT